MKQPVLLLLMASAAMAASAQTPAKPAVTASKPATTTAKPATTTTTGIKLPPGVPPVRGIVKTAFTLRYQDIKIGTGADAEPGKMYKVHYTGYRAADGVKFDSSFDHPGQPEKDKDGKPVLGEDGKPKLGPPQPMAFPQGMGRLIPGFDQGFAGMKIGGKRRLFIPWQLAYGMRAIPDHGPDHPGIPAKSDLIFDVELVDVTDMPAAPTRPGMGAGPGGRPGAPGGIVPHPVAPGTPGAPPAPGAPATPGTATPPPGTTVTPAPGTVTPPTPGQPATPAAPATPPASSAPSTAAPTAPSTPAPSAPTTPQPPK
jgi:peptidylprolyl isomerase